MSGGDYDYSHLHLTCGRMRFDLAAGRVVAARVIHPLYTCYRTLDTSTMITVTLYQVDMQLLEISTMRSGW